MSNPSSDVSLMPGEDVPMQPVLSSGQRSSKKKDSGRIKNHRRLAIGSIICGISCIGILSLINSVKAQESRDIDPEKAEVYSRKARKCAIVAIAVWVGLLVLIPCLMVLVSYLLTLID